MSAVYSDASSVEHGGIELQTIDSLNAGDFFVTDAIVQHGGSSPVLFQMLGRAGSGWRVNVFGGSGDGAARAATVFRRGLGVCVVPPAVAGARIADAVSALTDSESSGLGARRVDLRPIGGDLSTVSERVEFAA
ncbi:hypothetical protein [Brevibacterium litoralis]|uniref:hypothetical protein n=1 Tax=Brevibacterium litoralis TaxID=3138935 RepID=UPI0032F04A40